MALALRNDKIKFWGHWDGKQEGRKRILQNIIKVLNPGGNT